MIAAKLPAAQAFAARMAARAGLLAGAHAEAMRRARAADGTRWRVARLLWPLITKGP